MRRGSWLCIGAVVVLVAACGDPDAAAPGETPASAVQPTLDTSPATNPATTIAETAASTPLDDVVFPTEDGGWQGDPLVTCADVTAPLSAFSTMQPLSAYGDSTLFDGVEQSATVMDPALRDQTWYVVTSDAESVTLMAFDAQHEAELRLRKTDAGWTFYGGGTGGAHCTLFTRPPAGLGEVQWRIDPAFPTSPSDTEVHLLLNEVDCASGQPMGERLVGPRVMETGSEVRITFGVVPQEGDQNCPSNPDQPFVVPLSAPLGERTVLEGRTVGSVLDWLPFEVGPENVTLHVSNQSFADDPVHITVSIDGEVVVDQPFEVGSQHNWIPFELELEPGSHDVFVTSDTGVESSFTLEVAETGHTYAVLNYWYYPPDPKYPGATQTPRGFEFVQQDEPIGFA